MKKIAVMTSGGDSPGMNCAVRSVVRTALHAGAIPFGIEEGYKGMIEGCITEMAHTDVANIISRGGTILRTARSVEFRTEEGRQKAADNLKKYGIEGLIVIGGDGSITGAKTLEDEFGIKTIGIPGSIDNDIFGTDISLGVDTALNVIMGCVDMINNTASSHNRTFIIEVMGRHCGYLAVMSAIATGADAVIIPEIKPDIDAIVERFKKRSAKGKARNIMIVAEGAGSAYDFGKLLDKIGNFDSRITVLGHIQRGGAPTYFDRVLGSRMGACAVEALLSGKSSFMTGIRGNSIELTSYKDIFTNKYHVSEKNLKLLEALR